MGEGRKVWITRAEPGAAATAARVRARGHEPVVEPLLSVHALPTQLDLAGVAALAFTSGNGVRAFAERCEARHLPVFAVGSATAAAAHAAGFRQVVSAEGDVTALAGLIAERRALLEGGVVLHPGAAEPAGDLAGELARRGLPARSAPVYETRPAAVGAGRLAQLVQLDDVLLHSPKAARLLAERLAEGPAVRLRALCLSAAVAEALGEAPVAGRLHPPFPLEADLLNLLDQQGHERPGP